MDPFFESPVVIKYVPIFPGISDCLLLLYVSFYCVHKYIELRTSEIHRGPCIPVTGQVNYLLGSPDPAPTLHSQLRSVHGFPAIFTLSRYARD